MWAGIEKETDRGVNIRKIATSNILKNRMKGKEQLLRRAGLMRESNSFETFPPWSSACRPSEPNQAEKPHSFCA